MDAAEKKKPALSLVIGMGKGDGSKGEPKSDDDEGSELDVALEELFEAIKSDDLEAFKTAYKAVKSC